MPAIEVFAPRSEFFLSLLRIMWMIQHLTEGHYAVWGPYFSTLSMILQVVFARNEAAFIKYGALEHDDDGLPTYQNSSGLDYATFTLGMQRDAGSMYLALTYQELDDERVRVAAPHVRAVTVLTVAEDITLPFDGLRTQAAFAAHLKWNWGGEISAERVASLSAAQIHALRSPLRVWPETKFFCHHCSLWFDEAHPARACKGCHRALYCSVKCQRLDWKPVHKIACRMWRLVAERETHKKVRKAIKKLPLDPIENFPT
ncbi:hypothetical protein PENSPDRAFT_671031 [Peniophora sp. CONT]|nr:hypothetical protein PENSPDRAFT_671031 [Peniophora sp. CONT]